jgi:hypothetical protein
MGKYQLTKVGFAIFGRQRGVRGAQPPPLIDKNEYHTRTASFFYAVFVVYVRYGAALAARVLWRHKKEFSDLLNRGT